MPTPTHCQIVFLLSFLLTPVLVAEERFGPSGLPGAVLVASDQQPTEEQAKALVQLAGPEKAKLVVVQLGAADAEPADPAWFLERGASEANLLGVPDRAAAENADAVKSVEAATGIWLHSARPSTELVEMLRDTALLKALQAAQQRGVVIGAGQHAATALRELGLLPGLTIGDAAAGLVGVRVPSGSALLLRGRDLRMIGKEPVILSLAAGAGRSARQITLAGRDIADYNELRRAAVGRTQPAFPPSEVAKPEVPRGALVIVGGGGLPREIAERFVKLGGGAEGKFVVLPTAMPDPLPPDSGAGFLKRFGAKDVTVLSVREQADLEKPENLELLKNATAIWFGGGRQWRFVDAYAGTKVEPLLHDVLKRGGVIGGSSAGATIQGDYLVRGAPAGPQIMMCEGYERGLCFLPGVAIDQHFTQRKRLPDMTRLMNVYPQYLGIGLDEATAIVVQGTSAEVLGAGRAHFYDRRQPVVAGEPDYIALGAGGTFDLAERKITKEAPEKPAEKKPAEKPAEPKPTAPAEAKTAPATP